MSVNPLIAVYGIYKNEQIFIERFLHSIKDADEIVLCDTGSTDLTSPLIEQFMQSYPEVNIKVYRICVSPWRFDDARNAALSFVSPEASICVSLDLDEYLMDGWKEYLLQHSEEGYTRYHHMFSTFWSDGGITKHRHERIHSRNGYTWKLPVHEILEYEGEEKVKFLPDFWMYQKPDSNKPRSSYLPLLEQSVKERKDVWKTWSFLSGEYVSAGRYDEALQAIDSALELPQSDKCFLYKRKYFIYKTLQQTDMALLGLNNSIDWAPNRREPYFEKAMYLHQLGRNKEALLTMSMAESVTAKYLDYHYNSSAWDESFEQWKSIILELAQKEGTQL
jgi:glycosyltransferase involved in cell wall biosynthesis